MKNNTEMQNQIEGLYLATARRLYHLALYAIGDSTLAEQAASGAFSDAFSRQTGMSDMDSFDKQCFALLYRYGKKIRRRHKYPAACIAGNSIARRQFVPDHKPLAETLVSLDFGERFIVLLFCLQKYSVRQIACITRLPAFVIEKRLVAAVGKAIQ
jgi:DNA-directed RNA polymerase specialized sigma24 family protein